MIRSTILVALLLCLPAVAKDRVWQTGKLLDIQTQQQTLRTRAGDQLFYYTIESAEFLYLVSHLPSKARVPMFYDALKPPQPADLTINAPVKFAIEKDKFYLLDDKGKTIKVELLKKALKSDGLDEPRTEPTLRKVKTHVLQL
jgi:hypothetical protein